MISFLLLGDEITRIPSIGNLIIGKRSPPTAEALCFARINLAMQAETEYFSILDGGPDILLDNFETAMISLCNKMSASGLDIGSAKDIESGNPEGRYMQHAVVCRTSAFKSLDLPKSGLYHFEPMVYISLGKRGIEYLDEIVYEWIPSGNGAHSWTDTLYARANASMWATGKPHRFDMKDNRPVFRKL